jgi:hypothetical protein
MGNALRPQRCEDREAPIGGLAKDSIKPLSGFDGGLNRSTQHFILKRKDGV